MYIYVCIISLIKRKKKRKKKVKQVENKIKKGSLLFFVQILVSESKIKASL